MNVLKSIFVGCIVSLFSFFGELAHAVSVNISSTEADAVVGSWYAYIDTSKGYANVELTVSDIDEENGKTSCMVKLSLSGDNVNGEDDDIKFSFAKGRVAASSDKLKLEFDGKLQKGEKMSARIKYAGTTYKCEMTRTASQENRKVPDFVSASLGDVYPKNIRAAYGECFKNRNYRHAYRLSIFALILKCVKPSYDYSSLKAVHKDKMLKLKGGYDYEKANGATKNCSRTNCLRTESTARNLRSISRP